MHRWNLKFTRVIVCDVVAGRGREARVVLTRVPCWGILALRWGGAYGETNAELSFFLTVRTNQSDFFGLGDTAY